MLNVEPTIRPLPDMAIFADLGPHHDLLPGGEVEHNGCACWCHSDFDPNEPPELFSAPEAAPATEPELAPARYSDFETSLFDDEDSC